MLRSGVAVTALVALAVAVPSGAQWWRGDENQHGKKAQGAIVIRDGAQCYEENEGDEVAHTFKRGDAVAGLHREAVVWMYEFVEEDGRVQAIFPKEGSKKPRSCWISRDDLSMFTYDCGCEPECMPWAASFGPTRWNPCFQEARDDKLDRLRMIWAEQKR